MRFAEKVYLVCKMIPKGRISTYKEIARVINSSAYRAVGSALRKNKDSGIPCHRIIKNKLEIGYFNKGVNEKVRILTSEGVIIKNGRVDLSCVYKFE